MLTPHFFETLFIIAENKMVDAVSSPLTEVLQVKKNASKFSERNVKPLASTAALKNETAKDIVELSLLGKKALENNAQFNGTRTSLESLGAISDPSPLRGMLENDSATKMMDEFSRAMSDFSQAMEQDSAFDESYIEALMALTQFEPLSNIREFAERVKATDPKPAIELSEDEAQKIIDLIESNGTKIDFGNGDFIQLHEHKQYTFKVDGRVFVQDEGVPTSAEEKQSWLKDLESQIADMEAKVQGKSKEYWATIVSEKETAINDQKNSLDKAVAKLNEFREKDFGSEPGQVRDVTI